MSYPILAPNSTWFTPNVETITLDTITTINIVDSYTPSGTVTDSWDASATKDGSITVYVEDTALTIAGNGSGRIMANTDASYMFSGMINLVSVDCGVLDTSNATNMEFMFGHSAAMKLTSITFGENFNTSKVTNFANMFARCTTIKNIDVSGFDTSSAVNVNKMFNNCKALTYLDVSKWDTSNVENMSALFQQCNNLAEFSVAHFNTSKVKDMGFVFYGCKQFTKTDVEDWDVGNVETFDHFISNSSKITVFDTSRWNVSKNCKNLNAVFHSFKGESVDIRSWDTSNVEVFCQMFDGCSNLTEIKGLEVLDTSKGRDFTQMFIGNKIKHLDLSSIDTRKAVPGYPLGSNGTYGGGMHAFMYGSWKTLEKITFGDNFSFDGDGTCVENVEVTGELLNCRFTLPKSNTTSGNWITRTGQEYAPADIPNLTADTYFINNLSVDDEFLDRKGLSEFKDLMVDYVDNSVAGVSVTLESMGVTATAAELNFVDGVTSNIQSQIDAINASIGSAIEELSKL